MLDPQDPLLSGLETEKVVVESDPGVRLEGFLLRKKRSPETKPSGRRIAIIYFQGERHLLAKVCLDISLKLYSTS